MEQTEAEKKAAEKAAEEKAAEEAAAAAKKAAEDVDPSKVITMTEDQMNAFADKMFAKGATNSADAKKLKKLEDERDELQTFKDEAEKNAKKKGASDDDVAHAQALAELKDEYDKLLGGVKEEFAKEQEGRAADQESHQLEKLKSQVLTAANAAGAHDPEEVFILMKSKGYFKQDADTGDWVMLNPENGKIRIDVEAQGDPLSLKKGVAEYIDDRPHSKRSSGRQGSGPGSGPKGSDREVPMPKGLDAENLSASDVFQNKDKLLAHLRAGGKFSLGGQHNQ